MTQEEAPILRAAVIEECARIAEHDDTVLWLERIWSSRLSVNEDDACRVTADRIAAAIRKLAETPETPKEGR